MEGGQVAVAVKRVEVGTENRLPPDALRGLAGARLFGCRLQGDDVEAVLQRLKRLVAEEGTDGE